MEWFHKLSEDNKTGVLIATFVGTVMLLFGLGLGAYNLTDKWLTHKIEQEKRWDKSHREP